MSIEDKLAIQEVIAQYSYTYDSQDAEGFARLFVEDGVFEVFVPGTTTATVRLQSRTAIHAWAAQRLHARRGQFTSRHYQSGTLFDTLTSEAARTRTMVLVTHQGVADAAPRPTLSGVYHDHWRKTPPQAGGSRTGPRMWTVTPAGRNSGGVRRQACRPAACG